MSKQLCRTYPLICNAPCCASAKSLFLCKVCTEHFHNYNVPKAEINEDCIHYTKDAFVLLFSTLKIGSFKAFTIESKDTYYYYLGAQILLAFSGVQVLISDF